MVSYEVFYADRGRSSVRAGAQLLIVPTNTSSYATAQVPTQEIAASTVQAVQQGRDLLQAAPTGYSAAITNRGTLLERSVLGAPRSSRPPCPVGPDGRSTSATGTSHLWPWRRWPCSGPGPGSAGTVVAPSGDGPARPPGRTELAYS